MIINYLHENIFFVISAGHDINHSVMELIIACCSHYDHHVAI